MAALLVSVGMLGACGSDDDGDAGDVTVVADDATDGATDATQPGGDASADTAAAGDGTDAATPTLVVDDGSGADGDLPVTGDPALFALTELPTDQVCALIPQPDVESIVGVAVADPSGMQAAGLGTNCLYNDAATYDLVAKLEFSVFDWNTVKGLTSFKAEGVPATEDCQVAGRTALCTPEYELDGFATGAQVYVQLGGDGDIVLFTESSKGLDQATQLAELAFSNLTL